MRRISRMKISTDALEGMLKGEFGMVSGYHIETNAPADLRVLGLCDPDNSILSTGTLEVFLESGSFPLVSEGGVIPLIDGFVYHAVKNDK